MRAMLGGMTSTVGELFSFLWARKLYWLFPVVAILVLFAILVTVANTGGAGHFIYTLF